MIKWIYIVLAAWALIGCSNTGTGEYFVRSIPVVCDYPFNDTSKFAVTCRVWGLLKYYHPNVTAGKFDWDKVLLDMLDRINDALTPEEVNAELMRMVRTAGKYKRSADKAWNDSLNMNVSLCWLDHSFINDSLRQTLKDIASLTVKQPSHYVNAKEFTGALVFTNEKDYAMIDIMDYKYRLLALFRYWNVIYYFFPYKYMMDQPWDETLEEFIPQFMKAIHTRLYREAVIKLATRLNDGHATSSVLDFPHGLYRSLCVVDDFTVVRTPFEKSLLKRGDIILGINGKDIKTVRDSITVFIPSSNKLYTNNIVSETVWQTITDGAILEVLRDKQKLIIHEQKRPARNRQSSDTADACKMMPGNIGYVDLGLLERSDVAVMMDRLKKAGGIIFDLRNYPKSCDGCWDICRRLTSTPIYQYGQAIKVDLSHCGAFEKHDLYVRSQEKAEKDVYNGIAIVLTDALTASAGETMAICFRIHGATLIGTPTAGANGDIATLLLPGNINARYSSIGFFYPDGEEMQRKGIIPDIEVYPTMESIMEGKDEILERAITYINDLK
ncbi:MAG: hypothetical protein LBM08_05060 [Dysgonamonadaceae bacterium]|jgi:C-terminal processing protease CtpA/Prc|nr:hypothetical protein [Dysgonamonadaceae bacterium]